MILKTLKKIGTKGFRVYYMTFFFVIIFFFSCLDYYYGNGYLFHLPHQFWITLAFTTLLSLPIHEFAKKNRKKGPVVVLGLNALSFVGFWMYFEYLLNSSLPLYLLIIRIMVMAFTILVLFVSYGRMRSRNFGRHLRNVVLVTAKSATFSILILLGLLFLTLMTNLLFELGEINFYLNDYNFHVILCSVLIFPLFFIGMYAAMEEEEDESEKEILSSGTSNSSMSNSGMSNSGIPAYELNFVSRVSLFYILMPLLIAYTVVLYIYFFKQAILMQLPNNVLAHLVSWYLFVSHVALYFISGISYYKNEFEKWILSKSRVLIASMIVPIFLLFVGIWIRIDSYGFTESRYFLLLFAIFNTVGLLLLYLFKWRAQFAILILAVCMLHISCYGALSVERVTYRSQMAVLNQALEKEGYAFEDFAEGVYIDTEFPFDHESASRIDSAAFKLLDQNVSVYERKVLQNLTRIPDPNMTPYHVASRNVELLSTNLSIYQSENILRLQENEYFFRINYGEELEVWDFLVLPLENGIAFYDASAASEIAGTPTPLYLFDFESHIIRDKAKESLYRADFMHEGVHYEVFLIFDYFNCYIDSDGKMVEGSMDYYTANILIRKKSD